MKKRLDYSALTNKVAKKQSTIERFRKADTYLGIDKEKASHPPREKIIRATYAITKIDVKNISELKKRLAVNQISNIADSHLIRLGLLALTKMSDSALVKISQEIVIPPKGRMKA